MPLNFCQEYITDIAYSHRTWITLVMTQEPDRITGKFIHIWMSFPVIRSVSRPGIQKYKKPVPEKTLLLTNRCSNRISLIDFICNFLTWSGCFKFLYFFTRKCAWITIGIIHLAKLNSWIFFFNSIFVNAPTIVNS